MIIAQIAAIPQRVAVLKKVINSLIHQVDMINLNLASDLNEGDLWCPAEILTNPKIRVQFHTNKLEDGSKFINAPEEHGHYVIVCDDDIEYPYNFVERMIYAHRMNGGIICVMGKILKPRPINSFFKDEIQCFKTFEDVPVTQIVEIPGTCGVLYHTSKVVLTIDDMKNPNTDICVGAWAKANGVICYVINHEADWLTDLTYEIPYSPSMFDKYKRDDSKLTSYVNKHL